MISSTTVGSDIETPRVIKTYINPRVLDDISRGDLRVVSMDPATIPYGGTYIRDVNTPRDRQYRIDHVTHGGHNHLLQNACVCQISLPGDLPFEDLPILPRAVTTGGTSLEINCTIWENIQSKKLRWIVVENSKLFQKGDELKLLQLDSDGKSLRAHSGATFIYNCLLVKIDCIMSGALYKLEDGYSIAQISPLA